jgi:aspartate kinase
MAIVVQKYGGSSVGDVARIQQVAARVAATRAGGKDVVVVVSAMGDTTDELMELARQVCASPSRRELDMLLTAGERISMALLSMALNAQGIPAVSFTGSQSGIITTGSHTNARILEVRPFRVQEEIAKGRVVIVAGYQGVSREREVTTLGRGGSDTTAVALAAALGAEACEIYSDVDGVYSADPRAVEGSRRLASISYEEMQELAQAGARVLNAEAVEFAKEQGIVIHARHAFGGVGETKVVAAADRGEARIAGVTSQEGLVLLSVEEGDGALLEALLERLDAKGIRGKQLHWEGRGRLSLVIAGDDPDVAAAVVDALGPVGAERVRVEAGVGAVSVIGTGINDDHRNFRRFLEVCAEVGEAPRLITTSRFRISGVVGEGAILPLVRALHLAFVG